MRLVAERYQEGFATTNDLLDTEADLVRAEGQHARARWECRVAEPVLIRTIGRPVLSPERSPLHATTMLRPRIVFEELR
jgi:outer membrane protein TolC